MRPFFTIAVTTYDRVDLLRQTLKSILDQSFNDFEVLVGNNNQNRTIKSVFPDLRDPRIQWIDHPVNLGYVGNVNKLREMARGRYFTSLSDDDVYFPHYLQTMHQAVTEHGSILVAFSNYLSGFDVPQNISYNASQIQVYSGKDWLIKYLSKENRAIGCYGVFEKKFIQSLGGAHPLGSEPSFSPYGDNLLAVHAAIAKRIAYCPDPLLYFRLHNGSLSFTSPNYNAYSSAQKDFFHLSEKVFLQPSNIFYRGLYFQLLLVWFIKDFFYVMRRSKSHSYISILKYFIFINKKNISSKKKLYVIFSFFSSFVTLFPRVDNSLKMMFRYFSLCKKTFLNGYISLLKSK